MSYQRRMEELTQPEALQLLGTVPIGRVVFTYHALPAIRPVNHLVEADSIIIRATMGAAITSLVAGHRGMVVAYEADAIDPARQLGWSVVVVGTARLMTDEIAAARCRQLLEPWVAGGSDDVISISMDMVRGYRLVPAPMFADTIEVARRQP
jgi:hypothetical protein